MSTKNQIRTRLKELTVLISETKKRLPAHSTKPPIMQELIDLEDEYDILHRQLIALTIGSSVA